MNTSARTLASVALAATALALAASGASAAGTDAAPQPDLLSAPVQTITPFVTTAGNAVSLRDPADLTSLAYDASLLDAGDILS